MADPRHPDDDELLDPESRAPIEEWGPMGVDDRPGSIPAEYSDDYSEGQEAG